MLTGKSTHNQRIERLWRDVFSQVIKYELFYYLEDEGFLDILHLNERCIPHHMSNDEINKNIAISLEPPPFLNC